MIAGIRRVQAMNYRCLRDVDVELDQFHVLVGANGSGKSALFDALLFAQDLLSRGLDTAVDRRDRRLPRLGLGPSERRLGVRTLLRTRCACRGGARPAQIV